MPRKKKRPRAEADGTVGDVGGSSSRDAALPFNSAFAARYETQKRRELLANVPAEILAEHEDESSSDEEEDELGELLTKRVDKKIAETLNALQRRDPKIYEGKAFFGAEAEDGEDAEEKEDEEEGEESSEGEADSEDEPVAGWDAIAEAAKGGGKVTLKDYVRENLLKDGRLSDSDDEDVGRKSRFVEDEPQPQTGSKVAFDMGSEEGDDDDDDDDDDGGDFFLKKEKSKTEVEAEEKDFEKFLKKQQVKSAPKAGDELLLHSYLERETTDEKERFLRDFVLNNGWLEKGPGAAPKAGDYAIEIDNTDITKPMKKKRKEKKEKKEKKKKKREEEADEADEVSGASESDSQAGADSDFDDQVDDFEHRYNFRFEEPGAAKVTSHARTVDGSMRRPDDRRKAAREARRQRKQHEKLLKTEEIKQLKNVKKREIESRLLALQEAAGDGADFTGFDLDGDFDPDDFSKQMESRFGDDYYENEDEAMKAVAKSDAVLASDVRLEPKISRGDGGEDEDGVENGANRGDVERLMDEYYALDYEDIIGGTPIRFKYRKVEEDNFNMNLEDILATDDKELNQMASLKYLAPYRSKRSIPKRIYDGSRPSDAKPEWKKASEERSKKKRKEEGKDKDRSKKKREKRKALEISENRAPTDEEADAPASKKSKSDADLHVGASNSVSDGDEPANARMDGESKKKKKNRKSKKERKRDRKQASDEAASTLPSARLAAYGL